MHQGELVAEKEAVASFRRSFAAERITTPLAGALLGSTKLLPSLATCPLGKTIKDIWLA